MRAYTGLINLGEALEVLGWEISSDDADPIVLSRNTFEDGKDRTELSIYGDGHVSLRQTFNGHPEGITDIPSVLKGALIIIWNFFNDQPADRARTGEDEL